jgi:hypothetical protein
MTKEAELEELSRRYKEYVANQIKCPDPVVPNSTQVEHPDYYNKNPSGVECLDVVRYFNFNLGNVIKYIWRAGLKDGSPTIQDLRKARFYLDDEIKKLEKEIQDA